MPEQKKLEKLPTMWPVKTEREINREKGDAEDTGHMLGA